jgi:methionyl-tRNA formyltransferase
VLDLPRHGCINIHPSLLPRYRGASPVTSAILAGEEFTGVSIMLMDSGLDTGPVLSRAQIAIGAGDTTGSLEGKLAGISAGLLQEVLERWPRGEIIPQPQDEAEASYCSVVTRGQGEIDWSLPAVDIERRARAFQPWPGCYTTWRGRRLKVLEAVPLPEAAPVGIGQVVALPPAVGGPGVAIGIGSGRGVLGIRRLQMEGKRPVSAAEFLHGQRQFIGANLTGDPMTGIDKV